MSKDYLGHKPPKPTRKEQELSQAIYALQQNFQLVVANMRAQVRAVCIANGISADKFVEAFHNAKLQDKFESTQIMLETEMMKKAQEEAKEKRKVNLENIPEGAKMSQDQLKEILEAEGDKIE
jgi:hypothetical protein